MRRATKKPFRVITWNVLTPFYTSPEGYPEVDAECLDSETRYQRVESFIKAIPKNTVLCLQEVCGDWAARFALLEDFQVESNQYCKAKMGCAILFRKDHFRLVETFNYRTAEGLDDQESTCSCSAFLRKLCGAKRETLAFAKTKKQMSLGVWLTRADTNKDVLVFTYHAPCCITQKSVTHAHLVLALQNAQGVSRTIPLVFCGDFNLMPCDDGMRHIAGVHFPSITAETGERLLSNSTIREVINARTYAKGIHPGDLRTARSVSYYKGNRNEFEGELDYVLCSGMTPASYAVLAENWPAQPIASAPSHDMPSDHYPVSVTFDE